MLNVFWDLRFVLRQLCKAPTFTLVVVLMLGLGIGANTAVYSVMNSLLQQLLPVSRPEGLKYVSMPKDQRQPPNADSTGSWSTSFSEPVFEALRQRSDIFEELIGYAPLSLTASVAVRHAQLPEQAEGDEVSGNFFSGLGVRLERGRGFTLADEKNHSPVVVLSYGYWTRSFAGDPDVLGQTIYVKGVPMTVVGVVADGFKGIEPASSTDFWIPLQNRPELNAWGMSGEGRTLYGSPDWWCLRMMARLRPGVSPMQAQQASSGTIAAVVRQTTGTFDPQKWKPLLEFQPARGIAGLDNEYRQSIHTLMGLVVLVLLLACINVVMMLQARNSAREREFSLRLAIGASRAMIFRQLLIESLVLVGAGASLGWLFAHSVTKLLAKWSGIETGLSPDRSVLLFTLFISAAAALVFGLAPLWSAIHVPVAGVLRSTSSSATLNRTRTIGTRVVLSFQVAVCLVLLMAAGLLLRTLRNYATQSLGVETSGLLVFGITPQGTVESHQFYRQLFDRIRQLPDVESVSMAQNRPGSGWSNNNGLRLDGVEKRDVLLRSNYVGPNFFHTMGIPLLAGREFNDADKQDSLLVVIVNETFVKTYLADTNPLGHQLGNKRRFTIVGVVRDSKYTSVSEKPMPMAYSAAMQAGSLATMQIEVRTRGDAKTSFPELRKAVASLYPNVPLEWPMTQQEQFEKSYRQQRMFGTMGGFFGVLASLLVATGLYGTYSYRVSRRTTEIGVRMALGAGRSQVLILVLYETLWVLVAGLGAGIPLTLLAVRPLKAMLYQMSPFDPVSFTLAIAAMILVSVCAALVPARRAASIDPMQALRSE
jgi:predicted permease